VRTLKFTLAYDGTNYAGWQLQADQPTLQGTLERAIQQVTGRPADVLASGRTDAGVHALGQVVRCRTESSLSQDVLCRALNAVLPRDMAVLAVAEAAEGFHPIRDALRKRYRYVIYDGPIRDVFQLRYSWHYAYGRLDADAMRRAAVALTGRHDFRSFQSSGAERQTTVRTIFEFIVERGRGGLMKTGTGSAIGCTVAESEPPSIAVPVPVFITSSSDQGRGGGKNFIGIEVEADGFLYNMVRALVGTLVQVGNGSRPETWPAEVLQAADRRVAGPTAPPHGLFLVKVDYPDATGQGSGEPQTHKGSV
jgi:tRNA pseudouridine38-40 synthase